MAHDALAVVQIWRHDFIVPFRSRNYTNSRWKPNNSSDTECLMYVR